MARILLSTLVCLVCIALYAGAATLTPIPVTFGGVVTNGNLGVISFTVTFQQNVALTLSQLTLTNNNTGAVISLSGSTLSTTNGGSVWKVNKTAGFYPSSPTTPLSIAFTNAPAVICPAPALTSVTKPTTVVGTGTPASCTEAALTTAIATGGIITFNCGSAPVTITVSSVKNVNLAVANTVIDGKGLITLSGAGKTRILAIQTTYDKLTPRLTLQNLAFTGGYVTDVPNTSATNTSGGALYRLGGAFTIINCDFYGNQAPITGQDVGGGAVYSTGGADTTIAGSTFSGNTASNGGGIGNLGNSFFMYNSLVNANNASGNGGNPGNGGNGGAISFDGQGVTTYICGSTLSYNTAGSFGGATFRVGYTYSDNITLTESTFAYNTAIGSAGAIYVQALTVIINNTTIMYNTAPGGAGLALQYQAQFTVSGCTIANNNATTSLGGGIYINSGSGTISDTTIAFNTAAAAFAAGISGSSSSTTLTRTIITNSTEGNIYVALSCFNAEMTDGGGNFQWPQKRLDGNVDSLCAAGVTFANPLLANVAANGCVTWTAKAATGSPAANSGARCVAGTTPVSVLTYPNGQAVPRGPFSYSFN
jgi:hypothetical protein